MGPGGGRVGLAHAAAEKFDAFSPGRKTCTWGRWLHTGEAGGIVGQTIAGIASLAAFLLVWTGLALAW